MDHGEKWKTDAPLRQGMQSITEAVMNAVPAYHHETMTKSLSEKLSKQINTQVSYMIENCKLEPAADATRHVLIGELLNAADKVSKDPIVMGNTAETILNQIDCSVLAIKPSGFVTPVTLGE